MEKDELGSEEDYQERFVGLKSRISFKLTEMLVEGCNELYEKEDYKNKQFLNIKCVCDLNKTFEWNINVNTIKNNIGELSSNSLLKFYHILFINEPEDNDILIQRYRKFKREFTNKINMNFLNKINSKAKDDIVVNYEIKNGYLNIYLTDKYKEITNWFKKDKKAKNFDISNEKFTFESIGILESCFPEKFSVPRQGNLIELTRGKIIINKSIDMASFEGIETFTYIWVVYVFHLHQGFLGSKISPPKYEEGKKLGVFATRTPHRINPIGLTLCKFIKIEGNEIYISCIDMVSGTPILDIKPYHHLESINVFSEGIKYPNWIKQADEGKKANVIIKEEAEKNLDDILKEKKLIFYSKKEEIITLIKGVLEIDPHSKFTKKKKETLLYAFHLDKLNVIYDYKAEKREIVVYEIEYSEEYKKLRNKQWTENYMQKQQKKNK